MSGEKSMSLNDRLSDPNNLNPLFQRILALSTVYHKRLTKKIIETRTTIGSLIGGSVLGELLEREPDVKRIAKSRSARKWELGSYGGNIEVYASPSGQKFIIITNGLRRGRPGFKAIDVIPVKKIQGLWVEWKEPIAQ